MRASAYHEGFQAALKECQDQSRKSYEEGFKAGVERAAELCDRYEGSGEYLAAKIRCLKGRSK